MSKKKNYLNDFDSLERKKKKAVKRSDSKFDPLRKNKKYLEKQIHSFD